MNNRDDARLWPVSGSELITSFPSFEPVDRCVFDGFLSSSEHQVEETLM